MPRIILGPKELRFELDMAVRKFGRSIDRDLNHRTNEMRQDVTLRIIIEAIAQRLDKLEVVREVDLEKMDFRNMGKGAKGDSADGADEV